MVVATAPRTQQPAPWLGTDLAARFTYHREYRGPLQGVILDWAGTTQDHGVYAPAVVFIDVFRKWGVEITMAEARAPMGLFKLDHIRAISRDPGVSARWREVHGRDVTEEDVQGMFRDFQPMQIEAMSRYATLIPGTVEAVDEMKRRGYRIGSTTGFMRAAADVALAEAERQGYVPDATVCADEVPAGRPEPWMVLRNMELLRVFPPAAVVKVGDTKIDIDEGINAGVWTVGISRSGNYVGLNEAEYGELAEEEQRALVAKADDLLRRQGAHYVVETISDVLPCLDDIEARLRRGERP
ncbi:MAG: phosphonoacetaldehyde hydrolase [Chloroflexi bacterium]|nr:phosphonoacetaldehyde hydrolase [Chloroflexota bacterium]